MAREFHHPDYTYRATLDRVVDGDTVDVFVDLGFQMNAYKRLRFLDVDTEELRDSDPERRVRAYEAKARVEEILNEADAIYVQTHMDATGKYGRLLAVLWAEKDSKIINVNELLVSEGFQKRP